MVLQIGREPLAQLAGAVAVDDADLLLIGDERVVEELRDAIDGLIDRAADDVQLAEQPLARLADPR